MLCSSHRASIEADDHDVYAEWRSLNNGLGSKFRLCRIASGASLARARVWARTSFHGRPNSQRRSPHLQSAVSMLCAWYDARVGLDWRSAPSIASGQNVRLVLSWRTAP